MYTQKRWDIYFRQHNCPCAIMHATTRKLLYCNDKFLKQFDIKAKLSDLIGTNINKIPELKRIELVKEIPTFDDFEYFESEALDKVTNTKLHLRSIASVDDDTIFCELLPINDIIEHKFEQAMSDCLDILLLPQDEIIPNLMQLIRTFYNAHSSFINRLDFKNKTIQCEFDWCSNPEFEREINDTIESNTEQLLTWYENRNEIGVIEADINKANENPYSLQILKIFDLKNIVACVIEDENQKPVAVIGLNEYDDQFLDYRLLKSVANFIGQGLDKVDAKKAIFDLKNVDELTGFYSRISYSQKIDDLHANLPKSLGIISVNINGLKVINEQLGYTDGDKHIKLASNELKSYFDYDFYRVSGDEFIGLAENIDKSEFEEKVTSVQQIMHENKEHLFALGFSFGFNSYDLTKLVIEAETFMYINKQEYYSKSDRSFNEGNDSLLADLFSSLRNDEFMIYLQPQVRLKDSTLYGAEALIRRFDKTNNKMIFPDQFISLYEQNSIIRHVDIFVVEATCKLLADWIKIDKQIPISVNLSRVTLQEFGIVDAIVEICDKYNVPHKLLVIEVTERVGLIENNVASSLITAFKNHGFNISLDDFGCAYSNIVTLAQIEVDEVKIDKSLVDDLTTSKKNHILVKNVLTMCNELDGASTLAEGIEDEHQAKLLYELGCHLGQGYFFSRPIPVPEFIDNYINV